MAKIKASKRIRKRYLLVQGKKDNIEKLIKVENDRKEDLKTQDHAQVHGRNDDQRKAIACRWVAQMQRSD